MANVRDLFNAGNKRNMARRACLGANSSQKIILKSTKSKERHEDHPNASRMPANTLPSVPRPLKRTFDQVTNSQPGMFNQAPSQKRLKFD